MNKSYEVNFDGLVGPTHNYAGLSYGNVASLTHKSMESNPREAALQGLAKMKALHDQGFKQAIIPPQERPDITALKKLGFFGSDEQIMTECSRLSPMTLAAASSASSMWTANAATVSPSFDSEDGKVHFTAANLVSKFHRSIESETTSLFLKTVFKDPQYFVHHDPLPTGHGFGDEGAANHTRFCGDYGASGVQLFIYGKYGFEKSDGVEPAKFPARQTREASEAIARLHKLGSDSVIFAQQNPHAIDAGAFHNDVVSVGNQNTFFFHEEAFLDSKSLLAELSTKFFKKTNQELNRVEVKSSEVSLGDAIQSYIFNSQLLATAPGKMKLIAPLECQEIPSVKKYLDKLIQKQASPISEIQFFDLRQSMRNGGGPACLRLRVVLSEEERAHALQGVFLSDALFVKLQAWVRKHYRDRLTPRDLADPKLLVESRQALDELTVILGLGSLYPFQRPSH